MTLQEAKDIDRKKWDAVIGYVRAASYFGRLLREREFNDPELTEARIAYQKALRKFKRMQRV